MYRVRIYEFWNLKWNFIREEEISMEAFFVSSQKVNDRMTDLFYRLDFYKGDEKEFSLLTINPFEHERN
jgi:hypothetical protein